MLKFLISTLGISFAFVSTAHAGSGWTCSVNCIYIEEYNGAVWGHDMLVESAPTAAGAFSNVIKECDNKAAQKQQQINATIDPSYDQDNSATVLRNCVQE